MIIKGSGELQQLSESREDAGTGPLLISLLGTSPTCELSALKLVEQNLQFSTGGGQLARG